MANSKSKQKRKRMRRMQKFKARQARIKERIEAIKKSKGK